MRIEELVMVHAPASRARRALVTVAAMREWLAPDVSLAARGGATVLAPGDRFRLEILGVPFDYVVEGVTDRDVVFAFDGAWRGGERWSFISDGSETVVRRVYEAEEAGLVAAIALRTVGWAMVTAHLKLELARFRAAVERSPSMGEGEIEAPRAPESRVIGRARDDATGDADTLPFPVDEG